VSFSSLFDGFNQVFFEVTFAIIPLIIIFFIFIISFKLPRSMLINLLKGFIFAFIGLLLFLQGVKAVFLPIGAEVGSFIAGLPYRWILIPIGFVLGFVATLAEPAVRILCKEIDNSSSGTIRSSLIMYTLCLSVGLFVSIGMVRILFGIPFYYLIIPGYIMAIVLLFFSKPSFTAIAFDSGGVATGPMTVTFIMALAVGAADQIEGRSAIGDGFGLVALVALAPIIVVMILGLFFPQEEESASIGDNNIEYIDVDKLHDTDGENNIDTTWDNEKLKENKKEEGKDDKNTKT